jgi:hypothetical protein
LRRISTYLVWELSNTGAAEFLDDPAEAGIVLVNAHLDGFRVFWTVFNTPLSLGRSFLPFFFSL